MKFWLKSLAFGFVATLVVFGCVAIGAYFAHTFPTAFMILAVVVMMTGLGAVINIFTEDTD